MNRIYWQGNFYAPVEARFLSPMYVTSTVCVDSSTFAEPLLLGDIAFAPTEINLIVYLRLLSLYGPWPYGTIALAIWPQLLVSRNFGKLTGYHIFKSFSPH